MDLSKLRVLLLEIEEIGDAAVIGVDDAILHKKSLPLLYLKIISPWDKHLELKTGFTFQNKVFYGSNSCEFIPI